MVFDEQQASMAIQFKPLMARPEGIRLTKSMF